MKLINMTPHDINLMRDGMLLAIFPKSGVSLRCAEVETPREGITVVAFEDSLVDVPFVNLAYGEVSGLPAFETGVYYIASGLACQAAWSTGRRDVVCPAKMVRNDAGQIIGCEAFGVSPE